MRTKANSTNRRLEETKQIFFKTTVNFITKNNKKS